MNDERVKQIYEQLNRYEIELAADPISLGPKYLQEIIATCRNYLNNVTRLLNEVSKEKQLLTRELNALQGSYDIDADHLLANDERVQRLPNIKDRESTVKVLLKDQIRVISSKKADVSDIACVEKAVKHKHAELRDTMDAIKMQRSLIQAEISTGAMYGDERGSTVRRVPMIPPDMIDDDEVRALLDQSGQETKPSEPAAAPQTEPEKPSAETARTENVLATPPDDEDIDADVAKFLGNTSLTAAGSDDDFSSLIS